MEKPRIEKDEAGISYFVQADVKFPIDAESILKSLDVIDKLNSGLWVKLAAINDIPSDPFDKKLLKPLLMGIVQNVWWKVLGRKSDEELEKLENAQRVRVEKYKARLEELKQNPDLASKGSTGTTKVSRGPRAVKSFRLKASAKEVWSALKGQKKVIADYMVQMNAVGPTGIYLTTSMIGEGIKSLIETKQPAERVAAFYMNDWGHKGLIEDAAAPPEEAPVTTEDGTEIPKQDPEAQAAVEEIDTTKPNKAKKKKK